jgi:secreted trypsin-like serine protease
MTPLDNGVQEVCMSRQRTHARPLATLIGLLGLALAVLLPTPAAHAATPTGSIPHPDIIGGSTVSSAPWAAVVFQNGSFTCSGTIVASRWVLTARHCLNTNMSVRVGSVQRTSGGVVANVIATRSSPNGDLALLNLDRAVNTTFSPLSSGFPAVGATNNIYGWGRTSFNGPAANQLKTATVRVTSTNCRDAFGGRAICSNGISGVAWKGDSGGPQFSGGLQVGVASTANGSTSQTYGSVATSRSWIRSIAGV